MDILSHLYDLFLLSRTLFLIQINKQFSFSRTLLLLLLLAILQQRNIEMHSQLPAMLCLYKIHDHFSHSLSFMYSPFSLAFILDKKRGKKWKFVLEL
jgi:hypothetical protein